MSNLDFRIMSSWTRLQNAFPHRFTVEFAYDPDDPSLKSNDRRYFKKFQKMFVEYLKQNFGKESDDWMIAKYNGPYNFGAYLMVGFRDNTNAAAFILENT